MRETYTEPEDKITPRERKALTWILHLPRELKVSTDEKSVSVRAKNLAPLAWLGQERWWRREFW